jgi:hypothetical protein
LRYPGTRFCIAVLSRASLLLLNASCGFIVDAQRKNKRRRETDFGLAAVLLLVVAV